jgi:hypothetical protein
MSPIEKLTAAQEAQIPLYRERWRQIVTSNEPLDRERATAAVRSAYEALERPVPEIIFFNGPYEIRDFWQQCDIPERLRRFGTPILFPFRNSLFQELRQQVSSELFQDLGQRLSSGAMNVSWQIALDIWMKSLIEQDRGKPLGSHQPVLEHYWHRQQSVWQEQIQQLPGGNLLLQLGNQLGAWGQPLGEFIDRQLLPADAKENLGYLVLGWHTLPNIVPGLEMPGWSTNPVNLDFCFTELSCKHDNQQWQALKSLSIEASWILAFEQACLVMERPTVAMDAEGRFHAEGYPALRFADGFAKYIYHGTILGGKYSVHPSQWQSRWLLEEDNAEMRRVLIQGIGYSRLCQELDAKEIDTWREYSLLEIEQKIDVEPIHLLKMTCPSTDAIYTVRVPPDLRSARVAAGWINWDNDPEEFAIES